ncbi:hypothetical protein ACOME3_000602 [Neoechinorhynchus agilis]
MSYNDFLNKEYLLPKDSWRSMANAKEMLMMMARDSEGTDLLPILFDAKKVIKKHSSSLGSVSIWNLENAFTVPRHELLHESYCRLLNLTRKINEFGVHIGVGANVFRSVVFTSATRELALSFTTEIQSTDKTIESLRTCEELANKIKKEKTGKREFLQEQLELKYTIHKRQPDRDASVRELNFGQFEVLGPSPFCNGQPHSEKHEMFVAIMYEHFKHSQANDHGINNEDGDFSDGLSQLPKTNE